MEPPTGVYYYLRDLIEALSQRWNTYVVGYDLHKQVRLFDDVSRGYERLRSRAGMDKGPLRHLTGGPVMAGLALALLTLGYFVWKQRRQRGDGSSAKKATAARDPRGEASVALFRALESALAYRGITRPPSTPPLRHAEQLQASRHPLGPEVLLLTKVYLETRFGGFDLTDATKKDFEHRIRQIRTTGHLETHDV